MNRTEVENQNLYYKNRKKRNDNNNGRNYLLIIICTLLFYYGCYSSAATYVNRQINVGQVQGIACMYPMICFDGVGEDPVDHKTKDFTKYLSVRELRSKLENHNYRFSFRFFKKIGKCIIDNGDKMN